MIIASSSYVRIRGSSLCCAQARWDTDGKLKNALPSMLSLLHDPKPTVVRQCLGSLHEVKLYHPELSKIIDAEVQTIDLSNHKDRFILNWLIDIFINSCSNHCNKLVEQEFFRKFRTYIEFLPEAGYYIIGLFYVLICVFDLRKRIVVALSK